MRRASPTRRAQLRLHSLIVMPSTTPVIKVDAVRDLGAEVVLTGDSYADAQAHCDELVETTGRTFVHPFDDRLVIAGQGTIGNEILRHQLGDVAAIFVPVGGGGLIAGIASYVKALRPEWKSSASNPTMRTPCINLSKPADASSSTGWGSSPTVSPCARSAR